MATAKDLRRMALALEGTTEAPHFDRAAFKVACIYVTSLPMDARQISNSPPTNRNSNACWRRTPSRGCRMRGASRVGSLPTGGT